MNRNKTLSVLLAVSLFSLLFVGVGNVSAIELNDYNSVYVWGDLAATTIIGSEWITDADISVELLPTDVQTTLSMTESGVSDATIIQQVVDLPESSFGRISTDWIGVANDADYPASAGVDYWAINGSTSPLSEDLEFTFATGYPSVSSPSPASGGLYHEIKIMFPTDTDDTVEHGYAYFPLDGDIAGVDSEITDASYLYIQAAMTIDTYNNSLADSGCVFVAFSDGATNYILGTGLANSTSAVFLGATWTGEADDTMADTDVIADSDGKSPVGATGGRVLIEELTPTDGTAYDSGILLNIQDTITADPESADEITAVKVIGWGVAATGQYSEAGADGFTAKVRNVMIVDDIEDLCLYEEVDTSASSTKTGNNFINGTSITLNDDEDYPLSHGSILPLRVNRLVFSDANLKLDGVETWNTAPSSSTLRANRRDTFDTVWGAEEPIAEPTTWYLNVTGLNVDRKITQINIEGEDMYASDGDLSASWTVVDRNSAPSINDYLDIYNEFKDMDGELKITPKTAIPNSNTLQVDVEFSIASGDSEGIALGGIFVAFDNMSLFGISGTGWLGILAVSVAAIIIVIMIGKRTDSKLEQRIDDKFGFS